jgi:hypothetical protein
MDATTTQVRGAGGAVFEMDIPPAGTQARERFDQQVAKGDLVFVDADPRPVVEVTPPALDPELTGMRVGALRALAAERGIDLGAARGKFEIIAAIQRGGPAPSEPVAGDDGPVEPAAPVPDDPAPLEPAPDVVAAPAEPALDVPPEV